MKWLEYSLFYHSIDCFFWYVVQIFMPKCIRGEYLVAPFLIWKVENPELGHKYNLRKQSHNIQ